MAYSTTLPVMGGLAILATVTGVSLGRSAINEINPIYYQPASSHFYSDLVPYRGSGTTQADVGAGDYIEPDYAYSTAPVCAGCDTYPVAYASRPDKMADGIDDGWSASARVEAPATQYEVPEPRPANREWIERYTTYTIASEPLADEEVPVQEES